MYKPAWGGLTGIRPAKIVSGLLLGGMSDEEVFSHMRSKFSVSDDKIKLALDIAKLEIELLKNNNKKKISLYVGIPFCPTRCLYCSFASYSLAQYGHLMDDYITALIKELRYIKEAMQGYTLETVYIGGGTPTALDEKNLDRLLKEICGLFDTKGLREFSVEAGRPDTINAEKLKILKSYDVSRISINPQTMKQETLDLIGRKHTVDDFLNAYSLAASMGFYNINVDLILGLPDETPQDVENTFKQIAQLNPNSVTVHTLAVKRASRLKETIDDYTLTKLADMEQMLSIAAGYCKKMDLIPYYLYRLKNTVGSFENVGYCKAGFECIYNIQTMEERQTIIAAGAGGATKILDSETGQIRRIYNVKSVEDYVRRIDEMIERKSNKFI